MIDIDRLKHRAWVRVERTLKAQVGLIVLDMEGRGIDVRGNHIQITVNIIDSKDDFVIDSGIMELRKLK